MKILQVPLLILLFAVSSCGNKTQQSESDSSPNPGNNVPIQAESNTSSSQPSISQPESSQTPYQEKLEADAKVMNECDFDIARTKALAKLESEGLKFIEDKFAPASQINPCSVQFIFYVKKTYQGLDGTLQTEDQIQQCNLDYTMVGGNFEMVYGAFINLTDNTIRKFN